MHIIICIVNDKSVRFISSNFISLYNCSLSSFSTECLSQLTQSFQHGIKATDRSSFELKHHEFEQLQSVVWMDLKERFDKRNLTRVYQLHREIYTMTQGTSSVSEYFSRLRNVRDEYLSLVPLPGGDRAYAEHMEQQKLMQFLMGLNETYSQSRNQILLTVPSPSLNQAYNMIMQDESQRLQSNMISQCAQPLQQLDLNDSTILASTQGNRFKKNTSLYCDYCNMKGHKRENCYKLVGYPQNAKFNRRKSFDKVQNHEPNQLVGNNFGTTRGPMANNANLTESATSTMPVPCTTGVVLTVPFPVFTPEQYQHILNLIAKEPPSQEAAANMTGFST
ncbi:uncharacterized protein [Nicotiana tomentosiformis]|uniref:uncharacterized protein isoform X2 n=1 Tax=Nicotiana tomentosiformis TaxID=4098 RepID=UPI00388CD538